jgi:hypothetical protein
MDIAKDIIKPYYKTNALKVHLDNNIIEQNTNYIFKFYVQGLAKYYKDFYKERVHKFYFGIPPKPGKCIKS